MVADYTVTFTAPKPGLFLGAGPRHAGQLVVRDIGSPGELIQETGKGKLRWSEPREFTEFALPRKPAGAQGNLWPRADCGRLGGEERSRCARVVGGLACGGGTRHCGDAGACASDNCRARARNYDRASDLYSGGHNFGALLRSELFREAGGWQERPRDRSRSDHTARDPGICSRRYGHAVPRPDYLGCGWAECIRGQGGRTERSKRYDRHYAASRRNVAFGGLHHS